jgi:hypothetical protein
MLIVIIFYHLFLHMKKIQYFADNDDNLKWNIRPSNDELFILETIVNWCVLHQSVLI